MAYINEIKKCFALTTLARFGRQLRLTNDAGIIKYIFECVARCCGCTQSCKE